MLNTESVLYVKYVTFSFSFPTDIQIYNYEGDVILEDDEFRAASVSS